MGRTSSDFARPRVHRLLAGRRPAVVVAAGVGQLQEGTREVAEAGVCAVHGGAQGVRTHGGAGAPAELGCEVVECRDGEAAVEVRDAQ